MEKADFQEVSMAFEEIRSIVRECGGKFQFDKHEDCVGVRVQSYTDKEPHPFRVVEIIVDEDDDVILFGDDFSEEVWESTFPDEVIGDGMIRIADALRRATRKAKDLIYVIIWISTNDGDEVDETIDCFRNYNDALVRFKDIQDRLLEDYDYYAEKEPDNVFKSELHEETSSYFKVSYNGIGRQKDEIKLYEYELK